jgi:5-methylcytosine-specific restriction enzyme subunit McrC
MVSSTNKNLIRLFEHESISCNDNKLKPHPRLFDLINKLNEREGKLLSLNWNELCATENVGLIQVKNLSIEILPKIYKEESNKIEQAQKNLLYLLYYCYDIPIAESEIALMQTRKSNWFEILTYIYSKKLQDLFKKGANKQYIAIEENLPLLKGKWMIQQHFRINSFQKHLFYVNYDEFSVDIPLNRILRFVTNRLIFQSQDWSNRKSLYMLDQWMEEISLISNAHTELKKVIFTRLNENYRPVFNLARLFIEGHVIEPSVGLSNAFAFTFDMNLLFERFIARFIKENRDEILPEYLRKCNIYLQAITNRLPLAKDSRGNNTFYMQPDIIFKEGDTVKLILDTKYKILNKKDKKFGISPSDMYQMAAYASTYDCNNVILLYPRTADVDESKLEEYELKKINCRIKVSTVDLRVDLTETKNKMKLINEISKILAQKEV